MDLIDSKQWFLHPEALASYQGGVVSMGAFDGCHLGHQQLLSKADAALSFIPAPKSFFNVNEKLLTLPEEKSLLYPHFVYMRFDEQLVGLSPQEFVRIIKEAFHPKRIIVGWDFHFGRNLSGTTAELCRLAALEGIDVEVVPPYKQGRQIIKSSLIRDLIKKGHIEKANRFLGYDYFLCSRVVHGKAIGRTIGFPTINLEITHQKLLPKPGVYAGRVEIDGEEFQTAISVIQRDKLLVEGHILNFDRDVYGKHVRLFFQYPIREQRDFDSFDALKEQIALDVVSVKDALTKGLSPDT
jgi:riboflavin kinase/FMN adenylyltransferase